MGSNGSWKSPPLWDLVFKSLSFRWVHRYILNTSCKSTEIDMNKPSPQKKLLHRTAGSTWENSRKSIFFSKKTFPEKTSSGKNPWTSGFVVVVRSFGGATRTPRSHCPNHFVLDRILAFRWSFECGYYRVPNQLGASVAGCCLSWAVFSWKTHFSAKKIRGVFLVFLLGPGCRGFIKGSVVGPLFFVLFFSGGRGEDSQPKKGELWPCCQESMADLGNPPQRGGWV